MCQECATTSLVTEADHFAAAALLMPTNLFTAAARRAGEGLKAIETQARPQIRRKNPNALTMCLLVSLMEASGIDLIEV
jgi:hypothetical protein